MSLVCSYVSTSVAIPVALHARSLIYSKSNSVMRSISIDSVNIEYQNIITIQIQILDRARARAVLIIVWSESLPFVP